MSVAVFDPKTLPQVPTTAPQQSSENLANLEQGAVKKVFIATQGCQMNVYDSEKMADVLGATDEYLLNS